MSFPDFFKLLLLSAIWGGSFLFMRVAAPEFGPFGLIWVRVAGAFLFLSPFLIRRRIRREVARNWKEMLLVSIFNSALPWCLLAYAVLELEAGFTALLNSATPIFAALVGFLWLRIPLTAWQIAGLSIGVLGVAILASERFTFDGDGSGISILAALGAALSYGLVSQYVNRYLSGISNRALAVGTLLGATLLLTPFAAFTLPESLPGIPALWCAAGLSILSTAIAFLLLFNLLSRTGATATTTVTFIIPVFGVVFGAFFLGETVTARILTGMAVAFAGAALTTKLIPRSRERC